MTEKETISGWLWGIDILKKENLANMKKNNKKEEKK